MTEDHQTADPQEPQKVSHFRALGCVLAAIVALALPLVAIVFLLQHLLISDHDRVQELADDAEIAILPPSSAVSTENPHLDPTAPLLFGSNDTGGQAIFLRFPVELPTQAAVTHADIVFRCADNLDHRGEEPMTCKIEALDQDDQPPFTGRRYGTVEALQRIPRREESAIIWKVDRWDGGESYATPNIAPLLEAFLARPGYRPGNALGLLVRGVGSSPDVTLGQAQLRSVEGSGTGNAPYLRILLDEP